MIDKKIVKKIKGSPYINNEILKFMSFEGEKYIFGGNNLQSSVVLSMMKDYKIPIKGYIKSANCISDGERKGYWKKIMNETPVITLNELLSDLANVALLVCTDKPYRDIDISQLRTWGFKYVYTCSWRHNSDMQYILYDMLEESMKH